MSFTTVLEKKQTELLLDHFKAAPSISPMEAQGMFLIRSLSRRINDLEARGYTFFREAKRDTRGQRYVRYHLVKRPALKAA